MNENKIKELEKEIDGLKETVAVYLGSLIREVVKEFGDEGREVVKEAARKGGFWQAKKFIKDNNIKERGTEAAAKLFDSMSDVELFKVRTKIFSDKKFQIVTNVCPYIKIWKEMGIDEEMPDFCILATYYDLGLCQAYNPKLKIDLKKDMIRGCEECVYEFEEVEGE
jgi:hypothetical protein